MDKSNKHVKRISLSLPPELIAEFDALTRKKVYVNRSKAVADVLRDWISRDGWVKGKGVKVATISILYDHDMSGVPDRITEIQHKFGGSIIASMHVHLSHDDCLEVIAAKGGAREIQQITNSLASVRGVKHCKLAVVR
jgi:CopG family nickel-responsive transcriptional regulator